MKQHLINLRWLCSALFVLTTLWTSSGAQAQRTLQAAEYFFDSDPGEGNGTPLSALDGSFDSALEALFQNGITLPAPGAHVLHVRVMDNDGVWSPAYRKVLYVGQPTQNTSVQLGEVFLDTDPGEGNGTPMIAYDGNFNEALEIAVGSLSGFAPGPHILHVRVQGVNGAWGPTFKTVFNVMGPAQIPTITAGEIFLDTDPGEGNGTPMIAYDGNFNDALEIAVGSLSGFAPGPHILHVRVQGVSGAWGPTFKTVFNVMGPSHIPTVTAGEFFFDTDPGPGNGIPMLAFDGNFDQPLEALIRDWSVLPDTGVHILAVRVKDVNNAWGPLFRKVIRITSCTAGSPPVVSITPSGTVYLCAGDDITLTATAGFLSYTWFKDNAIVGSGPTYVANATGIYKVHVVDNNGCQAFSPPTTIQDSLVTYYADTDGDGYGNPNDTTQACTMPSGYVANSADCNDNNSAIYPGAPELCDGLDNDCDTQVDEGAQVTFYADADGDGYGDPNVTQQACTAPSGYVANNQDCNDSNPAINPAAAEVCDGVDDDCNGVPDNGVLLTFHPDSDGDGYGNPLINTQACSAPSGYVADNQDCNDSNPAINPAAAEICNSVDDNCDGLSDDNDPSVSGQSTWYADADGDGFGNMSVTAVACWAPTGYVADNTDCNDGSNIVYPGAPELCNNVDDNCDNLVDNGASAVWYADADGDGFGNPASSVNACPQPSGYVADNTDCNDGNPAINPGASELCNNLDDDCDGTPDDGVPAFTAIFQGNDVLCPDGTTQLLPSSGGVWTSSNPAVATVDGNGLVTPVSLGTATFTFTETGTGCSGTTSTLTVTGQASVNTIATLGSSLLGGVIRDNGFAYVADRSNSRVLKVMPDGSFSVYCNSGLNDPNELAFDTQGFLYVANYGGGSGTTVSRIPPGGGPAVTYVTGLSAPSNITRLDGDTLAVMEYFSKKVYKIFPGGGVAGTANVPLISTPANGNRGAGLSRYVNGDIFAVTRTGGTSTHFYRINRFTNATTLLATNSSIKDVLGAANRQGTDTFYVADYSTHRIYKINGVNGASSVLAGSGSSGISDGPPLSAGVGYPYSLWGDAEGNVWFTHYSGYLRKYNTCGCTPSVAVTGSSTICPGQTTTLSPASGGTWTSSNPAVATVTNVGIVTGVAPGTASFTFTNVGGCFATTTPVTVTSPPAANISPATASICQGGSITLTASGGGTYLWSTGETTASITVSPTVTTTYSVTVTGTGGCTATASCTVTVNSPPSVSITGSSALCVGETTTLSPASGGTWSSSNTSVATVTNSGVVTAAGPGSATFTFTETGTGCQATTLPLIVDPGPQVSTVLTLATNFGGIERDSMGFTYVSDRGNNRILKMAPDGSWVVYSCSGISDPAGLAFDTQGYLYVANFGGTTVSRIPPGGGHALPYVTALSQPWNIRRYDGDTLLLQEYVSKKVFKIYPGGGVAGSAQVPLLGTPPLGIRCGGIAVYNNKDILVASYDWPSPTYFYRIEVANGNNMVFLSSTSLAGQIDVAKIPGQDQFVSLPYWSNQLFKIDGATGTPTPLAGTGIGGNADGAAFNATFTEGTSAVATADGNVWMTQHNGRVRKYTTWVYPDGDGDGFGDPNSSGVSICGAPAGYVGNQTDCNDGNSSAYTGAYLYADADGDGYGSGAPSYFCYAGALPSGYVLRAGDCNDANASMYPCATETCNGLDDDCDGQIDDGFSITTWYADADGDGYGDPNTAVTACVAPPAHVSDNQDCNDANASIYPGATEVCNGLDDDCDGFVDEGVLSTWYADADGDGYGNPGTATQSCTQPTGYVSNGSDCNDGNPAINPTTVWYLDADGDGYWTGNGITQCNSPGSNYYYTGLIAGGDCQDNNASAYPGATEVCNGLDDDCDGLEDEGLAPGDPAVFGLNQWNVYAYNSTNTYAGYYTTSVLNFNSASDWCTLCSPSDAPGYAGCPVPPDYHQFRAKRKGFPCGNYTLYLAYHDDAAELYLNGTLIYQYGCCGTVPYAVYTGPLGPNDEVEFRVTEYSVHSQGALTFQLNYATAYPDSDGDGYGDPLGAGVPACTAPAGYVGNNTDCNPTDNTVWNNVTLYADGDGDGYGAGLGTVFCVGNTLPPGYVTSNTDCQDASSSIYPGAPEACNGLDDDCDGQIDEGYFNTLWYADADGDGYGDPNTAVTACVAPPAHVSDNQDCNDANASIYPGATEVCNGLDDDCDGFVDEGVLPTWYADADVDGYGDPGVTTQSCTQPVGYVSNDSDCNDSNPAIHSGATEVCNGVDDDCDGFVDEGVLPTWYADADGDGYGDPGNYVYACTQPSGHVSNGGDCNDSNPAINSGATEVCNGVDDDCDGFVDEGVLPTWYADADGDGYGDPGNYVFACTQPIGYVSDGSDCNDSNPAINPGVTEVCGNGLDDDCDGLTDEACLPVTQLVAVNCGMTLSAMSEPLRAIYMPPALQYEFNVTDGSNHWYIVRPNRGFYLSMLSGMQYGSNYQVRVRWNDGSQWSAWGPWCNVTTPSVPLLLKLDSLSCNVTLSDFGHIVKAVTIPINYVAPYEVYGASQYQWELAGPSDTLYHVRTIRAFTLSEVSGLQYGTTYSVRVRSLVFGQWSAWGPACTITTPAWPPVTQMVNCNTTVTDAVTLMPFYRVFGATSYEIWLYNGSYDDTITRPQPSFPQNPRFRLNMFTPVPGIGTYNVRIRAFVPGQGWTPWGPICQVTYGSFMSEEIPDAEEPTPLFQARAFPVPFENTVNLMVSTWSEDPVRVTVLDMNGRIVDDLALPMLHNALLTLGERWAPGVYLMRVQQGTEVRTLRVIKTGQ